MKAIVQERFGPPEVLQLVDTDPPEALGAEVTGVCSTRNAGLVRSIGAAHVVDYTTQDFTDGRERYDVILDNVGNRPGTIERPRTSFCGRPAFVWHGCGDHATLCSWLWQPRQTPRARRCDGPATGLARRDGVGGRIGLWPDATSPASSAASTGSRVRWYLAGSWARTPWRWSRT
jgi:hypothetical protein